MIDTHCHLNFPSAFPDPAAEIAYARESGVDRLIVVGCDLESSHKAVELANQFAEIYAVVGFHPTYTAHYTPEGLREVEEMLKHPKAVAIGEIGLDYHWDYATPEQQYRALRDQLDLAVSLDLPVVFHCREAYPDLLDLLEERRDPVPMLFHCFAGDATDARRAMALDCYFGVDGPLTYKKAEDLRTMVKDLLPRDRLVIETDAPYLTPTPHRGKPNRPGYVALVSSMLATVWEVSREEAAKQTTENAVRFFRL